MSNVHELEWPWPQNEQPVPEDLVRYCIEQVDQKWTDNGYPIARAIIHDFLDELGGKVEEIRD